MPSNIVVVCPVFGGHCPRAAVRPAREHEEEWVHCARCGAEMLVGENGALSPCPRCGEVQQ